MLLRFDFKRMPHTSEMWNMSRGFEDLYYAILFSTADRYEGDDAAWTTWVSMGLDLGIREAPPRSDRADRISTTLRSAGKVVEVTVTGGRSDITEQVWTIIDRIVGSADSLRGSSAQERAKVLAEDPLVGPALTAVSGAGKSGSVLERPVGAVIAALERDIAAFSYPDLVRVTRTAT